MQTKEEKPRLKNKGSITLEASTCALVPVAAGGMSHICPSQALSVGPRAACTVMLDPLLAELHSETSQAARAATFEAPEELRSTSAWLGWCIPNLSVQQGDHGGSTVLPAMDQTPHRVPCSKHQRAADTAGFSCL